MLKNAELAGSRIKEEFGNRVIFGRPLSELNTFGTGGNARFFIEAKTTEELSEIVKFVSKIDIPYFLLGGGSNLLVSDDGYEGLVIKNSIMGLKVEGTDIHCGAGEDLRNLVNFAAENSLTGLEFATGIYGTVGGAIYGNAGAYGSETGSVLKSAQVVDRHGDIRHEKAEYFDFSYRSSRLKTTGEFVATAIFALKMGKREVIRERIDEIQALRNAKLPINQYTAGCFFKNIPDEREEFGKLSVGKLLDKIGAKKLRYKGARVFDKHANIIINDGSASSDDIRKLSCLLKRKVRDKFGIELTEEITILGNFKEDSI